MIISIFPDLKDQALKTDFFFFSDIYCPPTWTLSDDYLTCLNENSASGLGLNLICSQLKLPDTTLPIKPQNPPASFWNDWTSSNLIGLSGLPVQAFTPRLRFPVSAWPIIVSYENMTNSTTPQSSPAKNPASDWAILIILPSDSDKCLRGFCLWEKKSILLSSQS